MRERSKPQLHVTKADPGQSRFNLDVRTGLSTLLDHDFSKGVILARTTVNGATRVAHKLGRKPKGWWPISQRVASMIVETQDPDSKYLYLTSASSTSALLFVY